MLLKFLKKQEEILERLEQLRIVEKMEKSDRPENKYERKYASTRTTEKGELEDVCVCLCVYFLCVYRILPRACVRVGIPGFFLNAQRGLGQDGAEPAGDVLADVVHLVRVLALPAGPVSVGPVLQDLHPTAFPTALLSTLLLQWGREKGQRERGVRFTDHAQGCGEI